MKIKQFSLESSYPQDAWTPIRLKAWLQVAKWGRYTVMILGEWIITYAVLYTSVYFCWLKVLSAFSCESKIRAIESKLKLMESGCDHKTTSQGKHPLLVQSERTRSHPYKKEERYSRGRGKHGRWQTLLPDAILMKESFLSWGTDCFRNGILFWNLNWLRLSFFLWPNGINHAADQVVQILDHCNGKSEHFEWSLIGWDLPFRLLPCHKPCIFFVFKSWKIQGLSGYLHVYYYLPTNLVS